MEPTSDITKAESTILSYLPATYAELADLTGARNTTIRDHVASLINKGVPVDKSRGKDGTVTVTYRPDEQEHPTNHNPKPSPNTALATHTKKKKSALIEMKEWLADDLNGRAPAVADGGLVSEVSNEDLAFHRSDDHIGAEYDDEFGVVTFDPEIATDRVKTTQQKGLELKRRQEKAGVDFDTGHLILGGDHVHGEGIHKNQPWESAMTLVDQVETASDLYMDFIEQMRDEFKTVQVVCQNGNHGELRGDGMSNDANADDVVFMTLDKRIRDRGYDDVTFIRSEAGNYTNFQMRGHNAHLRHGQKSLFHIGTSSGKKRWLAWLQQHNFDIAYRGHYHEFRIENIHSKPVVMSGAVCPPSDYEEGLGTWSEPAATVHGVSDTRPISWMYPLDFQTKD
jgi:predicted phosphodiesterase